MNRTPREDFCQLSPMDVFDLLYNLFQPDSLIQFHPELGPDTLNQLSFYRLCRHLMNTLADGGEMKLTAAGNLPRKLVLELYDLSTAKEAFIEDGITKLNKEEDSILIQSVKFVLKFAELTKVSKHKLSLTPKGKDLLSPGKEAALFREIFTTHAFRFNHGYFDRYPQKARIQLFLGYILFLLFLFERKKPALGFYAQKVVQAFPMELEKFEDFSPMEPKTQYLRCVETRSFERFLAFYDFFEKENQRGVLPDYLVNLNPCFFQTFFLDREKITGTPPFEN